MTSNNPYLAAHQSRRVCSTSVILGIFWQIIVPDGRETLLFKDGRFVRILPPGKHRVIGWHITTLELDMREGTLSVVGQEVLMGDQIAIRISAVLFYKVSNAELACRSVQSFVEHVHLAMQEGIRVAVSSKKLDELLSQRETLAQAVFPLVKEQAERVGVEALRICIKDIMIAGELKQAYADAQKARLEGQAILEKARGETAAVRSLLNATQLMDAHPGLYQLRYLQTIDRALAEGKGHTIMLGVPESVRPTLPARESK